MTCPLVFKMQDFTFKFYGLFLESPVADSLILVLEMDLSKRSTSGYGLQSHRIQFINFRICCKVLNSKDT